MIAVFDYAVTLDRVYQIVSSAKHIVNYVISVPQLINRYVSFPEYRGDINDISFSCEHT